MWGVLSLKMETTVAAISFSCFFLSIYLVIISMYGAMDEFFKKEAVAAATSFFVGGTVIVALFVILKLVGRALSGKKNRTTLYATMKSKREQFLFCPFISFLCIISRSAVPIASFHQRQTPLRSGTIL
jgi:hypothetical protein